jgi:hypothetical protein
MENLKNSSVKTIEQDKNSSLTTILKRDGTSVGFDLNKIIIAIDKAMKSVGEYHEG